MKLNKDENGGGFLFGALLLFAVLIIFGAFSAAILQTANDGYTVDNNTSMGKAAEANENLMSIVVQAWPAITILGVILIIGTIAALFTSNWGHANGRW